MNSYIMIFLLALVIALIMTPVAIKIAHKIGALDIPMDNRRMHNTAMPRFGGMAIYLGTIISLLVFLPLDSKLLGVIAGGTIIFIVGIVDDLRGISAKVKLLAQVVCAIILFQFSVRISFATNPFGDGYFFFPWWMSLLITVVWIVGITNTINLIDGLDGLAAGIACIASISISYTAYLSNRPEIALATLAIAGSSLGFLKYNFNPAKIFMGDGGSLFLGFMLASISVMGPMKGATLIATVVPMFVLALPIFDTAFAILRRVVNGRPIMEADKGHLHHRLMAAGLGQKRTVLTLYGISGIMGVSAILITRALWVEAGILALVAMTLIYVFIKEQEEIEVLENKIFDAQEDQKKDK